jgi:hypothetical protein
VVGNLERFARGEPLDNVIVRTWDAAIHIADRVIPQMTPTLALTGGNDDPITAPNMAGDGDHNNDPAHKAGDGW